MIQCTLYNIGVYHVFLLFAYLPERMWCMENVWRSDDSAHRLLLLGWQESGLKKSQNLLMLLLKLPLWIWKVREARIEWSKQGCWPVKPKHQSGRELMVSRHFFEGLWHNEAPSVYPRAALWTAQLSPSLAGRSLPPADHTVSGIAYQIESLTWKEYLYQQPRQTSLLLN